MSDDNAAREPDAKPAEILDAYEGRLTVDTIRAAQELLNRNTQEHFQREFEERNGVVRYYATGGANVTFDPGQMIRATPQQWGEILVHEDLIDPAQAMIELKKKPKKQEEEMASKNIVTMRDARKKHYEIFSGPDDEKRGQKEGILKYIESLGVQTQTDVSEWKLSKFKKNGRLITDKKMINKIFFSSIKKTNLSCGPLEKLAKKNFKSLLQSKKVIEDLSNRFQVDFDRQIRIHQQQIKSSKRNVENHNRQALLYTRDIEEKQKKIDEIIKQKESKGKSGEKNPFHDQLMAVLKTGKFSLIDQDSPDAIKFETAPINKSFFDKRQATNIFIPLGTYMVSFYPGNNASEWQVYVDEGNDNINVNGYLHPHLEEGGGFCFGSMGDTLEQIKKTANFYEYMMAVWDAIANFEDNGDHYTPLYKFEERYKEMLKEGSI